MTGLLRLTLTSALVLAPFLLSQAGCKKKPKAGSDGGAATAAGGAAGPSSAQAAAAGTPTGVQSGEGVVVWKVAQLRALPGDKSTPPLANLTQGTRVLVLERRDGWSRVRPSGGKSEGWLVSQSVQGGVVVSGGGGAAGVATTTAAGDLGRIRIDKPVINLRNTANGKKVIAKLKKGESYKILRDEGEWLNVEGEGKKGWVARHVVTVLKPKKAAGPSVDRGSTPGATASAGSREGAPERALGEGKVRWT